MNSSLFDYFHKELFRYYKFLNHYELKFEHTGSNNDDLTYSLVLNDPTINVPTIEELNLLMGGIKKIVFFAKLFDIKITQSSISVSSNSIYQYETDF